MAPHCSEALAKLQRVDKVRSDLYSANQQGKQVIQT